MRSIDWQACPLAATAPRSAAVMARSRSAEASTTSGSLPPSSRHAGIIRSAVRAATLRPVATEPVKHTASTRSITASPTSAAPTTISSTSATSGTVASAPRKGAIQRGVISDGLSSTAHPASSAGTASMNDSRNGKFHGAITATSGYGHHCVRWRSAGIERPACHSSQNSSGARTPQAAIVWVTAAISRRAMCRRPVSTSRAAAIAGAARSMAALSASIAATRCARGRALQPRAARRRRAAIASSSATGQASTA